MATVHLWITGNVQGVFYRVSAAEMAGKLNLNGWVKNTIDGAVEATVNGRDEDVEKFISWCRTGPKEAQVTDIVITPKPDDGFIGFQVFR